MPSLNFWLLDINDEDLDGKPEIRLWGLDDEGHRTLIIDLRKTAVFLRKMGKKRIKTFMEIHSLAWSLLPKGATGKISE